MNLNTKLKEVYTLVGGGRVKDNVISYNDWNACHNNLIWGEDYYLRSPSFNDPVNVMCCGDDVATLGHCNVNVELNIRAAFWLNF